jgi:hypothetical protein
MTLPADIQYIFVDTLSGEKSVSEFEEWVYSNEQIETVIGSDDYLELISLNYKEIGSKSKLFEILERYTDKGDVETKRIYKLLTRALVRDEELPKILMTFYRLYCKGYSFLDNLGLGYGLAVEVPYSQADYWNDLTIEQQQEILARFYPQLDLEIRKVIGWLDTGKIIMTGKKQRYDYYFDYIDNRTEVEKMPTAYQRG